MLVPPGYVTARSMGAALARQQRRHTIGRMTAEELNEQGFCIFGTPETVRQRLLEYQKTMGFGKMVCLMQFGSLPAELTRKSMDLFAAEVMPHLRRAEVAKAA
jgi:alkanesulfonate monooxygenase SsuD/methylene tetrahydromethanopterin reductase-like flavin-dependent oxidoreductase (luciferase family)